MTAINPTLTRNETLSKIHDHERSGWPRFTKNTQINYEEQDTITLTRILKVMDVAKESKTKIKPHRSFMKEISKTIGPAGGVDVNKTMAAARLAQSLGDAPDATTGLANATLHPGGHCLWKQSIHGMMAHRLYDQLFKIGKVKNKRNKRRIESDVEACLNDVVERVVKYDRTARTLRKQSNGWQDKIFKRGIPAYDDNDLKAIRNIL